MENASKALIIAGAVLLSILLIAVGMFIFNSAQSSIDEAGSQMSAQQKTMFNTQFTEYASENQSGLNVKSLITNIIANNSAKRATGEIVTLSGGLTSAIDDETALGKVKSKINTGKRYTVEMLYNTNGLVENVKVDLIP